MTKNSSRPESPAKSGQNAKPARPNEKNAETGQKSKTSEWFRKLAHQTSEIVGNPWTFVGALLTIIIWAILGPACGFSDTWQLVINTATTIITFLMVFLIQNTQNRDAKAIHLKLDELIHAMKGARNRLIDLEDCSDEELEMIQEQFKRLGKLNQRVSRQKPSRGGTSE